MENKMVVVVKGIVCCKDQILIVRRSKKDEIGAGAWECPGGKIEFGEQLKDALHREIREETGLLVDIKELLYASTFQTHSWRQIIILTYLCVTEEKEVVLSEEHSDYRFVSPDQFIENLAPNIQEDMKKNDVITKVKNILTR